MFHRVDVAKRNLVAVDSTLLLSSSGAHTFDLAGATLDVSFNICDCCALGDGCALQIVEASCELADNAVRRMGVAGVSKRGFALVEGFEFEQAELIQVCCFHLRPPNVGRWLVHGSVIIVETFTLTSTFAVDAACTNLRSRIGSHGHSVA